MLLLRKTLRIILGGFACLLSFASYAQSYPPAWSNTATYATGDQVQLNGNVLRAIRPDTTPGKFIYANWELFEVRSNTTVMVGVGQTFTTLPAAWTYLENARVCDGAYLHIYISTLHGLFRPAFNAPFSLDHGSGARISLIGDVQSNVQLGGSGGFPGDGLTIDSGHSFGSVSNLSIFGLGAGAGVRATGNSYLNLSGVALVSFASGFEADEGAHIHLSTSCTLAIISANGVAAKTSGSVYIDYGWSCTEDGMSALVYASTGGSVSAEGMSVDGSNGLAVGADAEDGGSIDVSYSSIDEFRIGANAFDHSFINAQNAGFSKNGLDLNANDNGVINAANGGNPTIGVDSGTASAVYKS